MRLAALLGFLVTVSNDSTSLKLRDGQIFLETNKLNLIGGGPLLARLKNGAPVAYDFHLALMVGDKAAVRRRSFERFVVSYDLWEEKFAVTNLRKPRAAASGLAAKAIDAWCLARIGLPANGLNSRDNVWVRLEVRAVDPKQDSALFDSSSISVASLIEILSRPARRDEPRWALDAGPVEMARIREEARP